MEPQRQTYRGHHLMYDPKPIPDRRHDWDWWHDDYDGPPDRRCGSAPTAEAARQEIDEILEESTDG